MNYTKLLEDFLNNSTLYSYNDYKVIKFLEAGND